jgi:hypothetical protein
MTTITPIPEVTPDGRERVFWATDYQAAARLLRRFRHVRCEPYTPKSAACQHEVDTLAMLMSSVFESDAEGATTEPFIPARFADGSQLDASLIDEDEPEDDIEPGPDAEADEG